MVEGKVRDVGRGISGGERKGLGYLERGESSVGRVWVLERRIGMVPRRLGGLRWRGEGKMWLRRGSWKTSGGITGREG